jgi:hypothetical protein
MIPRPDAQSFTRFLTSLGVFLFVAGLVAPALVLRETAVLRVSSSQLAGLTPTGRNELERRQRVARTVGIVAPYGGGLLFLTGAVFIAFAIPRLHKQEGVSDARSTAELDRLLAEQDASDRRETLAREVHEQVASIDQPVEPVTESPPFSGEPDVTPPDARPPPLSESPTPAQETPNSAGPEPSPSRLTPAQEANSQIALRMQTVAADIETRVVQRIRAVRPPVYEVRSSAKLRGTSPVLLDALLVSEVDQFPDVIVEIKTTTAGLFLRNMRRMVDQALALLGRYQVRAARPAVVWLIVVLAEGTPNLDGQREVQEAARELSELLAISVVALDEIEMLDLPASLTQPISGSSPRARFFA